MAVVLDTVSGARARHPEKAHRPDTTALAKPDWIRVKAPVSPGYRADAGDRARQRPAHGLRGSRLPQYRRVLGEEARDLHDHGRHLHARLCLLQRQTGLPAPLDPAEPAHVAEATAKLGLAHVVVTSVDRDDLDDGGAAHFARSSGRSARAARDTTIEVLTPDFLRKDGAVETRGRGAARRVQPQSRNRAVEISRPCGRARAISPRSGCCSG